MALELKFDLAKLKNIKLTKEQQQLVVLGVFLVGGGVYGYWNYLMVPLRQDQVKVEIELKEEKGKLRKAKEFKPEAYEKRLAKVQEGIQFVSGRLPPVGDEPMGLQRLITMTLEDGMELGFNLAKSKPGRVEFPGFQKNIAAITVDTDYHKLGRLFSKLSGEDIVYNIEGLKLTAGPQNPVRATFTLVTYSQVK